MTFSKLCLAFMLIQSIFWNFFTIGIMSIRAEVSSLYDCFALLGIGFFMDIASSLIEFKIVVSKVKNVPMKYKLLSVLRYIVFYCTFHFWLYMVKNPKEYMIYASALVLWGGMRGIVSITYHDYQMKLYNCHDWMVLPMHGARQPGNRNQGG